VEIAQRWRYLAVLGLLGVGSYNALQYLALRTSSPLNVTLIASSLPVWTLLIGVVIYGIRPSRRQLAGASLSFAGIALVLARGEVELLRTIQFVEGDLLMLLAILGWAIYSWMLAKPPEHMQSPQRPAWDWAEFLMVQCLFGLVWTFAFAGVSEWIAPAPLPDWSWFLFAAITFIAIGPSVIAYRVWALAVAEAGPALTAIAYNLTPLFAALLSAAVIGDLPRPYHGVAFLLIVGGILVSSVRGGPGRATDRPR
jgi:drug/metabolite transporter (DMT)-like permease